MTAISLKYAKIYDIHRKEFTKKIHQQNYKKKSQKKITKKITKKPNWVEHDGNFQIEQIANYVAMQIALKKT